MKGKPRKGRAMKVAMIAMIVVISGGAVARLWTAVSYVRLEGAVEAAAEQAIGVAPTASSILATREAMRSAARDRGFEGAKFFVNLERRTDEHAVVFQLCAQGAHCDFVRSLARLLTDDELQVLKREGIGEHKGTRWKHHHH